MPMKVIAILQTCFSGGLHLDSLFGFRGLGFRVSRLVLAFQGFVDLASTAGDFLEGWMVVGYVCFFTMPKPNRA